MEREWKNFDIKAATTFEERFALELFFSNALGGDPRSNIDLSYKYINNAEPLNVDYTKLL